MQCDLLEGDAAEHHFADVRGAGCEVQRLRGGRVGGAYRGGENSNDSERQPTAGSGQSEGTEGDEGPAGSALQ